MLVPMPGRVPAIGVLAAVGMGTAVFVAAARADVASGRAEWLRLAPSTPGLVAARAGAPASGPSASFRNSGVSSPRNVPLVLPPGVAAGPVRRGTVRTDWSLLVLPADADGADDAALPISGSRT